MPGQHHVSRFTGSGRAANAANGTLQRLLVITIVDHGLESKARNLQSRKRVGCRFARRNALRRDGRGTFWSDLDRGFPLWIEGDGKNSLRRRRDYVTDRRASLRNGGPSFEEGPLLLRLIHPGRNGSHRSEAEQKDSCDEE